MTGSTDLTLAAVKMILSLALIFALLWAFHRWIVRKQSANAGPNRRKLIKIVDSQYLGVKKSIAVVQVPGSLLVIGVGADQINLLARIDQPDALSAVENSDTDLKSTSFKDYFRRMTGRQ